MNEENIDKLEKSALKEKRNLTTLQAIVYAFPNLGLTAILGVCVSFMVLYYVNIMGQPAIIAGGIYSVALYIYAVMCIVGGAVADKIGKKKVLIFSGPIIAIAFVFLWIPPIPTTDFGTGFLPLIVWLFFFSIVFRVMVGFFQPSLYALLPELSTDEQNRVKISMVNMLMMILGTVIGAFVPILLMGGVTESLSRDDPQLFYPDSKEGRLIYGQIQLLSLAICIFFLALLITMLIVIKEPPKEKQEKREIKEVIIDLLQPLKDSNYRIFLVCFFLFWIPFVAFQYLILNLSTFLLKLRGNEFIIMAGIAFVFAIISFIIWQKLSEKYGLKKTLSMCLLFAAIAFFLILILLIPMPHALLLGIGITLITLCLCSLVGTMVFPFAIISDIVDQAEIRTGKSQSGSYSGAFTMMGSLASATAMLIISIFLEIYGPEAAISYGFILVLGACFIVIALILFQKVEIVGTEHTTKD